MCGVQARHIVTSCFKSGSWHVVLAAACLMLAVNARAGSLPDTIGRQLPPGYLVLAVAQGRLTGGATDDFVVALARPDDDPDAPAGGNTAPVRPLLVFRARPDGTYMLAGRNDDVVMRHDQGGQCDPFDPERGLVIKGGLSHRTERGGLR